MRYVSNWSHQTPWKMLSAMKSMTQWLNHAGQILWFDLEERLANLISDHIVPRLVPELEIVPWRRSHVLAIQVYASPVRPHYLRREGLDRGVYAAWAPPIDGPTVS